MKTLQAWYAAPGLAWAEDPRDEYIEPTRLNDYTREGESCENMFWKIKSRVIEGWPEREPFAPLMDSSTVLISYLITFFGTLLFSSAGIPMGLNSCDTRYYSIWLICGTVLSTFGKLYRFAQRGHQIFKFYPLSPLAQSTLTANLTLPHSTTDPATDTTETSLPPLTTRTRPTRSLLKQLSNDYTRPQHGPLYSTRSLFFRTRRSTPALPRLRPLTVLLHASDEATARRSPAHHVVSGLFAGLVFIALTFLFGAQWGGNLVVVFYTVVAFLFVVAVARGLCVWLVWRLSRKAGLHVIECAGAGEEGEDAEGDEMAGVARVLASMTDVLVVSGDGRSYYYDGVLLNEREWWEGWRKDYVAGKLDGDEVGGDVEQGQRENRQKSSTATRETALMGMTELPQRLQ